MKQQTSSQAGVPLQLTENDTNQWAPRIGFAYRLGDPKVGDIVMLYYPLRPEKSFVKRVIAAEGDQVRVVDGKVYRNDVLMDGGFCAQ